MPIKSKEERAAYDRWMAWPTRDQTKMVYGPTALIAAMRCYVASKLGEEVDVPEELCGDIK